MIKRRSFAIQCQMDSFRLVRYEVSTGALGCPVDNILLQHRHNVAAGMILVSMGHAPHVNMPKIMQNTQNTQDGGSTHLVAQSPCLLYFRIRSHFMLFNVLKYCS